MTRSGRASGSGEGVDAATDRGAHDPEARAGPDGAQDPQDPEARARQICLQLLTAAPRTRAQLAQAMHRRGIPAEAAEAILVRFTDAGLIDDAAFARAWVESRHHSRGLSKRSLSAELRRHGVQSEEIRAAVDALDPDQEAATARHLVERKMASTRGRPPGARARLAAGMLARKGYPPGLAFRLIREVMQQEGAELDEMDPDQYLDPDAEDPDTHDIGIHDIGTHDTGTHDIGTHDIGASHSPADYPLLGESRPRHRGSPTLAPPVARCPGQLSSPDRTAVSRYVRR